MIYRKIRLLILIILVILLMLVIDSHISKGDKNSNKLETLCIEKVFDK